MKKVLLTTTAVVFTAGFVSAGDYSMSGAIKLTYGAFGTGTAPGATTDNFLSEADLDIAATSSGGAITMTGTIEIDEASEVSPGPVTISSGALTFTYDDDDIGALSLANAADGEDDAYGDYSVAFKAGGIGVTYTKDQESSDNAMAVAYTSGALSLSLTSLDETKATGSGLTVAAAAKTTIGATYVTGPYTIGLSGNDATVQEWDASVAMANGDTTITVAADETEMMSVGIGYTNGSMTVSARQEFNNTNSADDETEVALSYTDGALTFGAKMDSGNSGNYGDESELVINAAYVDGDVTVAAKGTDRDEMEVSVTFEF